jgi:hypothetical protein
MKRFTSALLTVLFPIFAIAPGANAFQAANPHSRPDADLQVYKDKVKTLDDAFAKVPAMPKNKGWVKKKLAHMVEVDQYMRLYPNVIKDKEYTDQEEKYFWSMFGPLSRNVDETNTKDLKELLKIYDWFTISEFGREADNDAWLLVQHADLDVAFQEQILAKLEVLYKTGETRPDHYAYLYDRVASSSNDRSRQRPQRYGTQGHCVGKGKWIPDPLEDAKNVDALRKEVGLPPLAEYIAGFKTICR